MSMIYDAKRGWIEVAPIVIRENNQPAPNYPTREQSEVEGVTNLIDQQVKNLMGYVSYLKNRYAQNPNDLGAITELKKFSEYLTKTVGPGMIGEWKNFSP